MSPRGRLVACRRCRAGGGRAQRPRAGRRLAHALDSLVFRSSASDFDGFNEAYRAYFPKDGASRTTVEAAVPREGFLVEIRIIAGVPGHGRVGED